MDYSQKFVRYVESTPNNPHNLNFIEWISRICPYEVNIKNRIISFSEIDNLIEGRWSSYIVASNNNFSISPHYFELESDALAFKLRWV